MEADDQQGATGDWVGLLGFSQGAKLCASLLYTQQYCRERLGQEPPILPHFRFGVLLAGRSPLVWLDSDSNAPPGLANDATTYAASQVDVPVAERLRVPTLHIHGLRDPGLESHRELLKQCCDATSARVLEWDGVHSVPLKTVDVRPLADAILSLTESSAGTGAPDER